MLPSTAETLYFDSWRTHDWQLLRSITATDISYEIESKDGLRGHDQLKEYWERNSERQKELVVHYQQVSSGTNWSIYTFYCRFLNVLKKEYQVVFGQITFRTEENGKICRLVEKYTKVLDAPPEDRRSWLERSWDAIVRPLATFSPSKFATRAISFLAQVLFIFIPLVAFIAAIFEFSTYSDEMASLTLPDFWKNVEISAIEIQARVEQLESFFIWVFSSSTIIYFLLEKVSEKLQYRANMRIHKIGNRNADASRLMARYLSGARKVSVFAGDFDFFEDSEELLEVFRDLQNRGELTFFSERSSSDVSSIVACLPRTTDMIHRLRCSNRIFFNSNLRNARATVFEKDGITQILNLQDSRTFVVLSGIDENKATVKLLRSLLQERISVSGNSKLEGIIEADRLPDIIFVCGESGSGKTTIAMAVKDFGYNYISVSDTMREMTPEPLESRSELIDFGKELLSKNDGRDLADALKKKIQASERSVIDGLRPPVVLQSLLENFGANARLVYVVISRDVQNERIKAELVAKEKQETITLKAVRESDRAFRVAEICERADLILYGSGDLKITKERLINM